MRDGVGSVEVTLEERRVGARYAVVEIEQRLLRFRPGWLCWADRWAVKKV